VQSRWVRCGAKCLSAHSRAASGTSKSQSQLLFVVGTPIGSIEGDPMSEIVSPEELATSKEEGVIRVLVGFPHEGMTPSETYINRLANMKHLGHLEERGKLLKQSPRFEFYFASSGRMHVHVAREELGKKALSMGADYLFMIDDDMIAPDDLFERLYSDDKDIIAPLAFTRNYPHKPVMYSCIEGWDPVIQREHFVNYAIMNYPKDKLAQCDAVGFGAVLIKMECLKKMPQPWFMNVNKTGEDINFCYEARKSGFTTWMDTRVKLGHLGHPLIITEEYVLKQRQLMGEDIEKRHGAYEKYATNGDMSKEPTLILGDK
jgi:hypothetical protein